MTRGETSFPRRALTRAALPLLLGLVLVAGLLAGGPGRPATAAAAAETHFPVAGSFALTGYGSGHGHGLSQYGAYGAALRGLTAAQILDFYYPGTATAAGGDPSVRVRLSTGAPNTATVLTPARDGALRVTDSAVAGPAGTTALPASVGAFPALGWRAVSAGSGRLALQGYWNGSWQPYPAAPAPATTTTGTLTFASSSGVVALQAADATQRDYRGAIEGVSSGTSVLALNLVAREDYLRSVVPSEMPSSWSAAALQAQAVAARTYEAHEANAGALDDICDTTACQYYQGVAAYTSAGVLQRTVETAATDAAVAATAGQLRTYAGTPILAQYGAADGGWTAAGGEPYLPAKADPYDGVVASGAHSWTATLAASTVGSALGVGTATELVVTGRDGNGTGGGRVTAVTVYGTAGSVAVSGATFAADLGLRSTWWTAPAGTPPTAVARAVNLYAVESQGGASGDVEVHALSAASRYQSFLVHAAADMTPRSDTDWTFAVAPYQGDGQPDLWAICLRTCGSGHVEVHVLSAASHYRSFLLHLATAQPQLSASMAATVRLGSYAGDGQQDLFLVLASGSGSGEVEVHVLSAASRWQTYLTHRATALAENGVVPADWTFLVGDAAGAGDLVAVHDAGTTGSGRTEVHVLSEVSGYQTWTAHDATSLALGTGGSFALSTPAGAASPDLYVLLGTGTGSGRTELHVLSGASRYTTFTAHVATALGPAPAASWTLTLG